jgi:hypothetical protein
MRYPVGTIECLGNIRNWDPSPHPMGSGAIIGVFNRRWLPFLGSGTASQGAYHRHILLQQLQLWWPLLDPLAPPPRQPTIDVFID